MDHLHFKVEKDGEEQEMVGFSSKRWYSKMPSLEHILLYMSKLVLPKQLPGLEAFTELTIAHPECALQKNKNSTNIQSDK